MPSTALALALAAAVPTVTPKDPHAVLIGGVIRHGTLVCPKAAPGESVPLNAMEGRWEDKHFQVGTVRVDGALEPHLGRAVLVEGEATEWGTPEPHFLGGGCLPAQMRSDWEPTPDGIRVWHGSPAPWTRIKATKITPVDLTATTKGGKLTVRYVHPAVADANVTVVVHYEGCYGKPGSDEVSSKALAVRAGKAVTFSAPVLLGKKGEHRYAPTSVRLVGDGGAVVFDLDVSLGALGVTGTGCPND